MGGMERRNREPLVWFMPWRWNRWIWAMLLPWALLVYFLSAVPVLRFCGEKMALGSNFELIRLAYRPIWIIDVHCGPAAALIDWEDRAMDRLLGTAGDWVISNPGGSFWFSWNQIEMERIEHGSRREVIARRPPP
jgi:hypothetical protein